MWSLSCEDYVLQTLNVASSQRTAGDTVGYRSVGEEEDHGAVFLRLLYVHHPAVRLRWQVRWEESVKRGSAPLCSHGFLCCRTSMTVLIFVARAFISGGFQAAYVYTPEARCMTTACCCCVQRRTGRAPIQSIAGPMTHHQCSLHICRCTQRPAGLWGWA